MAMAAAALLIAGGAAASDVTTGIASVDDGKPTRHDAPGFHGRLATGGRFDANAMSVASRDLPLGACIDVWTVRKRVRAFVDDRGPCFSSYCRRHSPWLLRRILDLKPKVARRLACDGLCRVSFERVACDKPR